jgi:hypothetical protein
MALVKDLNTQIFGVHKTSGDRRTIMLTVFNHIPTDRKVGVEFTLFQPGGGRQQEAFVHDP